MDVKQEINSLRAEIMEHNRHYYDEDAPVISDFEYDALMRRLEELEAAHPEFYSPTSPTQKVGGTVGSSFARRCRRAWSIALSRRSTGCPCRWSTRTAFSCAGRPEATA